MLPMEKLHNGERLNLEVAASALRRFFRDLDIVGAGFCLLRREFGVVSVRLDSMIAGRWPYPAPPTRSIRFALCIVHQKKKMRARRAKAETTMPRPAVRMTIA